MYQLFIKIMMLCVVLFLSGCQTSNMGLFSGYASQASLTESVQNALALSGDPVIERLQVEVEEGVVTLSGYVKKIRQSDTAQQLASHVPGVKEVVNNIIIRK